MKPFSTPVRGLLLLAALALLGSCSATLSADTTSPAARSTAIGGARLASTVADDAQTKDGITLTPFNDSPKFPAAQLRLNSPVPGATVPSDAVPFSYELTNFQLTQMTGGNYATQLANSTQGQHINLIVDDRPFLAKHEARFNQPLAAGSHVVLSFLSRSYYESLKHIGAYDLRVITVGTPAADAAPSTFDVKAPTLFYSVPRDTYLGDDARKILLDFYLVNTTLSPDGNRVRATINGTEFMLDQWLPYIIEGLPLGTATIKLELVDSRGTMIPGPYNSVTRSITIAP